MKKYWVIGIIVLLIITGCLFSYFHKHEIPIDNSKFILVDDLNVEVYEDIIVSSLLKNIEGTILDDIPIDTSSLGQKKVEFLYKNEKGRKRRGEITFNVVDETKPIILLNHSYNVTVGYDKNLTDVILSADNYDSNPTREIIGEYDFNQVGSYSLKYKVTDNSGNESLVDFILNVNEKSSGSSYSNPTYTQFSDIVSFHKTDDTKIGLDVSKWQGEIDFQKLMDAGVEFIFIRVGTQLGFHESSLEDPYFKANIEGAKSAGIPIGIYYYSYATNIDEAKEQANWVIEQLKGYDIDLPIAFDWESWTYFNGLGLSIHGINEVANAFLEEIESSGYTALLYGSKYYLQNIWDSEYPVWLSHYTTDTDYDGSYDIWQLCDNGKVAGINGYVDINIMYK